jgi:hypothetical protein
VFVELQFGDDSISVEGPQGFVEEKVREFMFAVGKSAALGTSSEDDPGMLVKHPAKLRELYQKHGSTKQWENVVLFVNYFQNSESKDAVTYQDIRRAYTALGIKAPNIQASANSLKFNLKLLKKVRRGAVALTGDGERHVRALLADQKPPRPKPKKAAAKPAETKAAPKKKKAAKKAKAAPPKKKAAKGKKKTRGRKVKK